MANNNVDGDHDVFLYTHVGQKVLQDVTHARIHESITTIPREAFYMRQYLISVEMHTGVEVILARAFMGTSLTSINLSGVKVVDDSAFHGCTDLVDVNFGEKLDAIGREAFNSCHSLRSAVLKNVRSIGSGAFSSCKHLTVVECGEKLQRIEARAFDRSHSLRRIVIPLKVDMVGFYDRAFNCDGLSTIDLVEGIHKTISSLHLESWKSQMKQQIHRLNLSLLHVPDGSKTTSIQDWIVSTHRKFKHYTKGHDKLLKEATTLLELALWKAMLEGCNFSPVGEILARKPKLMFRPRG